MKHKDVGNYSICLTYEKSMGTFMGKGAQTHRGKDSVSFPKGICLNNLMLNLSSINIYSQYIQTIISSYQ